jgi:peptidoglycan/LPS O-acetylase OafA/YrhL
VRERRNVPEPHGFLTRSLEKIGEDSFGIYLTHLFFALTFAFALTRVGVSYDNLLFYPTLVFLTLASSYLAVEVIYRLPFSYVIIGKPRKKQMSITESSVTTIPEG